MKDLILIGGGGHCKSCIEVIEETRLFDIKGVLDIPEKVGSSILGYKFVGTDNDIENYARYGVSFLITVGQITADSKLRVSLYEKLLQAGAKIPVIVSNFSVVSKYANIASGTVVLSGVVVNADVTIGKNCILNSKALIEHDVIIGNHCHISTGAIINGNCSIGNNCMISTGAVLRNGISIPDNTMIGMSSVVTKSIKNPGIYLGNPARKIK